MHTTLLLDAVFQSGGDSMWPLVIFLVAIITLAWLYLRSVADENAARIELYKQQTYRDQQLKNSGGPEPKPDAEPEDVP